MKIAVLFLLAAMVATAAAYGDGCDILDRLNVKQQWQRAYSSGHDRAHFAEAIFRAVFAQVPEASDLIRQHGAEDTSSPKFVAYAMRVLANFDTLINLLDQPEALRAQIEFIQAHRSQRQFPQRYLQAFRLAIAHVLPAQLGRCFDKEPWMECFHEISAASSEE